MKFFSYVTVQEMILEGKQILNDLKIKMTNKPTILYDKLDQIQLIKDCHINSKTKKHNAYERVFRALKCGRRVFWKNLCADIVRVIDNCATCRFKRTRIFYSRKIRDISINNYANQRPCSSHNPEEIKNPSNSHNNSQSGEENLSKNKKIPRYIKYIQSKKFAKLTQLNQ